MDKQRILTIAVVFGGVAALALAHRFGVSRDVTEPVGWLLIVTAGLLRSMLAPKTPEVKP